MRQEMIERIAAILRINAGAGSRDYNSPVEDFYDDAREILDALLDALEAKQPILEAYELIEVLRGES